MYLCVRSFSVPVGSFKPWEGPYIITKAIYVYFLNKAVFIWLTLLFRHVKVLARTKMFAGTFRKCLFFLNLENAPKWNGDDLTFPE